MSDIQKANNQKYNEGSSGSSYEYENNKINSTDGLIIDDNTVYEIDQECYEKAKRARINQKKGWERR